MSSDPKESRPRKITTSFTMTRELRDRVELLGERTDRGLSEMCEIALARYVEAEEDRLQRSQLIDALVRIEALLKKMTGKQDEEQSEEK